MYFIYKYVYRDEIIYIGKTKRELSQRVYEHTMELKFIPYLHEVKIYYFTVSTHVEMDIYEKYLINKYAPKLNVVDMDDANFSFVIQELPWILYSDGRTVCVALEKPVCRQVHALEKKKQDLQSRLDELELQASKLENLDVWLDWFFDQYIADGWDARNGFVHYIWDMDSYPLPDAVTVDAGTYACFTVSKFIADGIYENRLSFDAALYLIQNGRGLFKEAYQSVRMDMLDLEHQLEHLHM